MSAEKPRLTPGKLAVVAAMNLVDCMNMNLLTPYADTMVSSFLHQRPDAEEVLQRVGLLIGLYNISEAIFSPLWGSLSDRIGRRPVLLIGLAGAGLMAIFFGLSSSLPTAFIFRALAGVMCGNIGVTKTYLAELVDQSNEARAFSILTTMYSLGMFIGPLIGGLLVFPAKSLPGLFEGTVFDEKPFLLPNLVFSAFCGMVWLLAACCLDETLPIEKRRELAASRAAGQARAIEVKAAEGEGDAESSVGFCQRLCSSMPLQGAPPSLLRMVLAYGLVVGYIIATTQTFVLLVQLPRSSDGFALTPSQVAVLQNCAAGGLMLTQLLLYPWLVQRKGYRWCLTAGILVVIMATFPFPLYGLMASPETFGAWRFLPLACLMFVQQSAFGFCTPTCSIWVNRFAAGLDRGSINGWTNSFAAVCRALSPELCSVLLGWGLKSNLLGLGRYLPIYATSLAGVAILLLTRSVLPAGPPAQQAKSAVDDGTKEATPAARTRAITWWHDEAADVVCLDEDLEAGSFAASARRSTW